MFELLLIAIALVGTFACGIYDLKTSNVPDSICILMIASALLIHSIYGFSTGDFSNLINSFLFGGLFLAFGLLMYFTGQWGGGDGELLVSIGFLLPNLQSVSTIFPFALSFFVNTFFIGAAYSILYSTILVYRNPKIGKDFWVKIANQKTTIPLMVLIIFSLCLALVVALPTVFFILLMMIATLIFFLPFSKAIEQSFYKKIPVSKLKVDDMLGEDIPRLRLYKRHIKGLTAKQIKKIKKVKRYVVIREGIRYGIVFPLTLVFTLLFGDIVLFFM